MVPFDLLEWVLYLFEEVDNIGVWLLLPCHSMTIIIVIIIDNIYCSASFVLINLFALMNCDFFFLPIKL